MRTGRACTPDPVTVSIDDSVVAVANIMRHHHVGDVIVLNDGEPAGILTDRDIVIGAVAQAADRLSTLTVRDILRGEDLIVADVEEPMWKTLKRMRDRGIRRMPVVSEGTLVGIFTLDDAIGLLAEQFADIASLIERQPTSEFHKRH